MYYGTDDTNVLRNDWADVTALQDTVLGLVWDGWTNVKCTVRWLEVTVHNLDCWTDE